MAYQFDPFAHMSARVRKHFDRWVAAISRPDADREQLAHGFIAGWNLCVQDAVDQVGKLDPDAERQAEHEHSSATTEPLK